MKMPEISSTLKGILLIITGAIILFDSLGFATQLLHNIVIFGSIAMIVLGIFMSNFHRKLLSLISKGNNNDKPDDHAPHH